MIRLEVFRLGDDTHTLPPQTSAGITFFGFPSVIDQISTEFYQRYVPNVDAIKMSGNK